MGHAGTNHTAVAALAAMIVWGWMCPYGASACLGLEPSLPPVAQSTGAPLPASGSPAEPPGDRSKTEQTAGRENPSEATEQTQPPGPSQRESGGDRRTLIESLGSAVELFDLVGVSPGDWATLSDGVPWQSGEDPVLLKVLYHLRRSFQPIDLERWAHDLPEEKTLREQPDRFRGEVFRLSGHVVEVSIREIPAEKAAAMQMPRYYRCRMQLEGRAGTAVVFAAAVPQSWFPKLPHSVLADALGVFLKWEGRSPEDPAPVFAARRIAWYPDNPLGRLGMDVGLLDELRPPQVQSDGRSVSPRDVPLEQLRLTAKKRECFFQMLAAAGRAQPGALLQAAEQELARRNEKRFDVAPLFNHPYEHLGRLVVLSGTARQVVPVEVGDAQIAERFGITRYHQIALYTDDSQGNPLIVCVRRLPKGMPTGAGPQFGEYVTVAGFFFGPWAYRRPPRADEPADQFRWQLAPLLIADEPVWHLRPVPQQNPWIGAMVSGVLLAILASVLWAAWRAGKRTVPTLKAVQGGTSGDRHHG